ncbi:MAG: hypothetical protein A2033_01305 [Bacteroidetes bacterium GWA2_31_9]|nr:MAG: hypothetical protein A2033_01305 [Bacteroidetes bacterium GWA2_31_9]
MNLLERSFKVKVTEDLKILNGEEFEIFTRYILELILNEKVIHKGQNLYAKPVGYTADFANTEYKIIGQSGTDEGYFDDFSKPTKDIKSAIKNHATAEEVYLFSNRYAGTARLGDLKTHAKDNGVTQKILPYDSERIAEVILDKILASHIVDEIFKYLPTSYELFKILPKTSLLPAHKDTYYERIEENNIIEKLNHKSIIQAYGLSGIGKTEITLGIAQKVSPQYETVLWIDGDSIQNSKINFNAIKISKFDKLINLATILETYKVLLIFDNINADTFEIQEAFVRHNKKDSKCLISSLTKSLDEEYTFQLNEVSDDIAKKILFGGNIEVQEEDCAKIITYTGKHPLILKIIHSAVKNNILNWESLILELEDVNQLTDKGKNQTISNRIIGKIRQANEKELSILNYINNRIISKSILNKLIGNIGVEKLLANSIIGKDNSKYYSIHQIILDSIKTEVTNTQWLNEFYTKIKSYLIEHNEIKDIGFYCFIFNHKDLLFSIFDKASDIEFKRIIIYSIIQSTDIKNSSQIDSLVEKAQMLIEENKSYYENLLSIELGEIKLLKIDKKKDKEKYELEAKNEIDSLNKLLASLNDKAHKSTILHHIGKLYFKIGEDAIALGKFEEVLELKPNDTFALLQIARISSNAKNDKRVKEITAYIFSLSECPLSILLSFYELISNNNYSGLKSTHIDKQIDLFTAKIIEAIDSRYDQPYNILGKISSHLSYNFPEYFETIVNNLPTPSNIDFNENLRFNFAITLVSYYKYLKYNGGKEKNESKMEKTLSLAKINFELSDLDTDFKKATYVDLLIEAMEFDLALEKALEFEDENEFNFQKLSKIYRGQGDNSKAIENIDKAIQFHKNSGKNTLAYIAAFLNDKAEAENGDNNIVCLTTLKEAIEKQPTQKTKDQWTIKLDKWTEKFNGS